MTFDTEYCPKCGGEIFAVYEHILCYECGWQGPLSDLLDEKEALKLKRKLKLDELKSSH